MFLDEARLAASLNHQNVAQVFEVGEDGGIHYLAMEYVHGQDLRALLAKAGSAGHARPARARADRGRGCGGGAAPRARAPRPRRRAARHRPPRRVAVEHHDRLRRRGEAARLRHREGDGALGRDAVRHHQGQVRLHGARAVPRPRRRSAQRRVLARHHPLRDHDPAPLLPRRQRLRHDAPHRHRRRRAADAARSRATRRRSRRSS